MGEAHPQFVKPELCSTHDDSTVKSSLLPTIRFTLARCWHDCIFAHNV